jgi:acid phosphatase
LALGPILLALDAGFVHPPPAVPSREPRSPAAIGPGAYFDYVVLLVTGNKDLCDILTTCGGFAPYLTGLAATYGLADQDWFCNVDPSLPNYLCLTGGSDFGCAGVIAGPNSDPCTWAAWNATNIVDRLEAGGLTWKAYLEDMPRNCDSTYSGRYVVHHNPFVYYESIAANATRCARVVPSGTNASVLLADLGSTATASNYMWFTPNSCNDMHDCSIRVGDQYLAALVPRILNSTIFRTTRAALLVTFDQAYGQPIYAVWAGPVAKRGFVSSYGYSHFSVLATIESNWNLTPLTSNDRDAPHMGEFFVGQPNRGFHQGPPHPIPMIYVVTISGAGGVGVLVTSLLLFRRERRRLGPSAIR